LHQVLESLLGHNAWATRRLLESCAGLSREQWNREFEIGPGSLRRTMTHIVGTMLRWADRISEGQVRPSIEDDAVEHSPADLIGLLDSAHNQLSLIAADVDRRGGWDEQVRFVMPDGKVYRFSKGAAMTHVLTHGMHHRAQALNIRRRLGLPPLGMDLDTVEWEAAQTGQL
jgi:uncharacterized damage-inducible protein DinB